MRKLCVPLRTTQPPASAQSLPSPLVLPFTLRSRERIRGRATGTNPPWAPAAVVAQRQVQPRRGLSTRKTLSNPRTHTAAPPSCFLNCPRGPTAPAPHAGARLLPQVEKLFLLLHPTVGRAKTITQQQVCSFRGPTCAPSAGPPQSQPPAPAFPQLPGTAAGCLYPSAPLFSGSLCCTCRPSAFSRILRNIENE